MRFLILIVFISFNLSIPLLFDNNLNINSNHSLATTNHQNVEHSSDSHNHNEAKSPCENHSDSSCTDHECCIMFVPADYKKNSLRKTITVVKFSDNSKIISHHLSNIFRPPII
jgi:hypothetical protein